MEDSLKKIMQQETSKSKNIGRRPKKNNGTKNNLGYLPVNLVHIKT